MATNQLGVSAGMCGCLLAILWEFFPVDINDSGEIDQNMVII